MKKYTATVRTSNIQDMETFPLRSYDTMERTCVNYEDDTVTFIFEIAGNGLSVPQQRYINKLRIQGISFTWEEQKEGKDYQRHYYENVILPRRRAEYAARTTSVRAGRPQKYDENVTEYHLKLDGELNQFFQERSSDIGYQAFFELLVEQEYRQVSKSRKNATAG